MTLPRSTSAYLPTGSVSRLDTIAFAYFAEVVVTWSPNGVVPTSDPGTCDHAAGNPSVNGHALTGEGPAPTTGASGDAARV